MRHFHYLMCGVLWAAMTWTAPPPLVAQQPTGTVRGRVTDNSTQQPIAGAIIAVGNRSTQTRDDGRFTIGGIAAGSDLSRVKMIGYVQNNDPGGGLSIRIRGATSVNASSEPLYVVDGVPLGNGAGGGLSAGRDPLNYLNPNDIESVTVLRDASAAAIYGSNAANGVVLITTKTGGTHQKPQFEYTSSASASSVTRLPSLMNAAQFAAALNQYAPTRDTLLLGASTDWFSLIDRTAYGQEHNFAVTNSTNDMSYRLSLGYLNQDGIIRASSTKRVSLGFNYTQQLFNDRLNLHTSVRGSRALDQFTPGDVLGNAAAMAPTQPVLDSSSSTGYWDWKTSNAAPSNPVASLTWARDHGTTWRSVGNVQAEYRAPFLEGLTANVNLGYDLARADRTTFYPSNLAAQVRQGQGLLYIANNSQTNQVLESYLGYAPDRTYGPGRLDVVGGYSYTQSHAEYPWLRETGLTTNVLGDNGIPVATIVQHHRDIVDYKLISFFGRLNYNINDRYLAAFSVRRDGSSRFGPGNQWGTFPSAALAWRISQESFMQGLGGLSDLKLRASWAKTGNQAFQDYLQYPTYTFSDGQTQVQFGNVYTTTIRPSAVDPNIHWEKTTAYNVGADFGFSNQRFSGTVDWYTKNTSDLIFYVPIPAGTNLGNYVTTNIGSMRNRGIELSLNADVVRRSATGLSWTASVTADHNSNELLRIKSDTSVTKILTGNISGGVGNLVEVLEPGIPINSFFVYEQRYDASGKPIYDTGTPTNMYVDRNGDGVINDSDRRPFHDPSPKWILGHTSYFNYKHFDVTLTLRAYLGNWVYNNVASSLGAYQNLTGSAMPANLHTSVLTTSFVVPQYYSDYFVEDASFLRMDNITIGYGGTYRGQQFRLFGTIQNAFTITGYSGVDPTSGLNGIDNNIYPRARTITTGLDIRF